MKTIEEHMRAAMSKRKELGAERELVVYEENSSIINLANNDYLELSKHPRLIKAAQEAIVQFGCSAAASPIITGYLSVHKELEEKLCTWVGMPYGLVWNNGYIANHSILNTLTDKHSIILADKLIHNSLISGSLSNKAKLLRYRHCDIDHLESLLKQQRKESGNILLVTESVFSMDGDSPDLQAIAKLKEKYKFTWMLDEAHAIGWYGPKGNGLAAKQGVIEHVDILVGTLGKSLGSMGAFSLFKNELMRKYLINHAGGFMFSTYLAPVCAAAASEAIEIVTELSPTLSELQNNALSFRNMLKRANAAIFPGNSPIVPIIIGGNNETMQISAKLLKKGFKVGAIRPPTVPQQSSRLRVSLKKSFSQQQMQKFVECL